MIRNFANFVCCYRLIARKLAVIFGFNCGTQPFYTACFFDELSIGSVSCLFNASFKKSISQRHKSFFYAKFDDHDVRRGDSGQIIARWRRPVAFKIALDLPYQAMRSAPYRQFRMATEKARKSGACFSVINLMSCITVAKLQCCGLLKIKQSYNVVLYYALTA